MTLNRPVRGCLIGIGGYGRTHLRAFDDLEKEGLARLTAVVVRNPDKYARELAALAERGVRCFRTQADALHERNFDFIANSAPLQLHRPMVIEALEAGVPVLCEKSAAPTVQDVQAMADAQARTGVPLDIAYPMQSSSAVAAIQRAVQRGCVGQLRAVVVRAGWLREERYYERSAWAGKVKVDGLWTLDGPVNNPLAHYLYAGMFIASEEPGRLAEPQSVRGELYRARPTIEGEDTACIEVLFASASRLLFFGTLVTTDKTYADVRTDIIGEDGIITWLVSNQDGPICVARRDGSKASIDHDGAPGNTRRCIANFARYLLGESQTLLSSIGDSLRFARASNGAFESSRKVHPLPPEFVERREVPVDAYKYPKRSESDTTLIYDLKGIVPAMRKAGDGCCLFSDIDVPWAVKTEPFDVTNYARFPQAFEADDAGRAA